MWDGLLCTSAPLALLVGVLCVYLRSVFLSIYCTVHDVYCACNCVYCTLAYCVSVCIYIYAGVYTRTYICTCAACALIAQCVMV